MQPLRSYFSILILPAILFFCKSAAGQTVPDSLLTKLKRAANDSVKARTLLDIGEAIEQASPEKSFEYYSQALQISKKLNNNYLLMSSIMNIGISYIESNKMDSALLTLEKAMTVARLFPDSFRLAKVLSNIGNVYTHKKEWLKAIEYYMHAAQLWEKCEDQQRLPALYSNINSLLNTQREYERAIEYGNKAVDLAQKQGDEWALVNSLLNLSNTYANLEQRQKQYELLNKALPLAEKNENLEQVASIHNNIGDFYLAQDKLDLSLGQYLQAYQAAKRLGNQYHLCTACAMLGQVYHRLNKNQEALKYITEAESMAGEIGERVDLKEIYLTRGEIESELGHYKLSAEYLAKTIDINDSIFQTTTSEKVAEVEAKYQNEKKQQSIVQLEKDKQAQASSIKEKSRINYLLMAVVLLLLIIGLAAYRGVRNRQQLAKKETELQQQRISELEKDKQLVAVDSMLKGQEEERSRLAKDLHDGLGGLLSGVKFSLSNMKDNLIVTPDNMAVFERSLDMLDSSIMELRRVAHNMMPEMLIRFGLDEALKEYCNTINTTKLLTVKYQSVGMDRSLDKSTEIIIYRIVQELINNTMKHAAATESFVQLIKDDNRLNLVVEDNGKGFDMALVKEKRGAGLASIQSRVDYLKGQLDINSAPGKGTLINIEFNL